MAKVCCGVVHRVHLSTEVQNDLAVAATHEDERVGKPKGLRVKERTHGGEEERKEKEQEEQTEEVAKPCLQSLRRKEEHALR